MVPNRAKRLIWNFNKVKIWEFVAASILRVLGEAYRKDSITFCRENGFACHEIIK